MQKNDKLFRAHVVYLILNGKVDEALTILSEYYDVEKPKVKIKRVKKYSRVPAVYSLKRKTIYIQSGNYYNNLYIILHEFYHHLRNYGGKHRGTEKNANKFAESYINAYVELLK